jgi:hypothetical protein
MVAGLGLVLAWGTVQADVITATITDDARVYDNSVPKDGIADGVQSRTDIGIGVGDNINNAVSDLIYVVELPTLSDGEQISKVDLNVFLVAVVNDSGLAMPNMQVDVFFKDSSVVEASDYSLSGSPAVASVQNFITQGSTAGQYYTWSDSSLVDAFNSVYSGSAPTSQYAVFRLRRPGSSIIYPIGSGNDDYYMISTSERTENTPSVTITTTIPEPASINLVALTGGLVLLARRICFR